MKRGITDIIDAKRGTTQISKIMRGIVLIWEKVSAPVYIDQPNLIEFPNEYENAYWSKSGATINGTLQIAPDGTNTARLVTVDASSIGLYRLITNDVSLTNELYMSVWLKADVPTDILIGFNGQTDSANNRGVKLNITTTWTKYTFSFDVRSNDTGIFVAIASTRWTGVNNTLTQRAIYVWGASYNIR